MEKKKVYLFIFCVGSVFNSFWTNHHNENRHKHNTKTILRRFWTPRGKWEISKKNFFFFVHRHRRRNFFIFITLNECACASGCDFGHNEANKQQQQQQQQNYEEKCYAEFLHLLFIRWTFDRNPSFPFVERILFFWSLSATADHKPKQFPNQKTFILCDDAFFVLFSFPTNI